MTTKINKITIVLILVIISLFNLGMKKNEIIKDPKIFKNIYIEDINVEDLTTRQAEDKINKYYHPKNINIRCNQKTWVINKDIIKLNYNVDKAVKLAKDYTRTEDNLLNLRRIFDLAIKKQHKIKLKASYDEAKLSEIIESIKEEIDKSEIDATVSISESSQIKTTESKDGLEVDVSKLKEKIYEMIKEKEIKDIYLPVKVIKPKINTSDVKSINAILGQYSTSFNDKSSRGNNIYIAGKSTSDIVIMPNETFSYNSATGPRTWSNGYKSAKVIVGGKYVNGEGGGVCQVSTTIYNAALISNMEIVEVHNHTYPSRYAPRGKDAAVSYGYIDFKFKNPYSHPVYIKNIIKNGAITTKIYGCDKDREKLYIRTDEKHEEEKIYVNTYRVYLDNNNQKEREELVAKSIYKIKNQ
ncbi:VanW family protein [Romboutsia hominis]|uniref:VanW family protein n=1 Tax=Romboutsia hominis TaxID=1507512 RepID=UPI001F071183|nr:VanW family protein [Romboutsia hominis]MCH1960024.1 VanW family protein [Romboutsia hominis]MCH1969547.1 VanW family protein [Romboutsia hominis]